MLVMLYAELITQPNKEDPYLPEVWHAKVIAFLKPSGKGIQDSIGSSALVLGNPVKVSDQRRPHRQADLGALLQKQSLVSQSLLALTLMGSLTMVVLQVLALAFSHTVKDAEGV